MESSTKEDEIIKREEIDEYKHTFNIPDGRTERGWQTFEREEWYKAAMSNIYTTSIEFDKTLIVLNSAIIAFIIKLLTDYKMHVGNLFMFDLLLIGLGFFAMIFSAASIYALVEIFRINPKYLMSRITKQRTEEKQYRSQLNIYDKQSKDRFIWSVVFIILFAIFTIVCKFIPEG